MRERGRYQLQLMKTRSSSGVGQKIDLEFDIETLKIRDLPEDQQTDDEGGSSRSSSIIDQIKARTSTVVSDDPTQGVAVGKVRANVEGTKLHQLINSLGSDDEE
jgi:hypothetical protein